MSRICLSLIILGIILGCSYTPKEIPPPSCSITEKSRHAVYIPTKPTLDIIFITQTTETIPERDAAETKAQAEEQTEETIEPLEQTALNDLDFEMNNRIQWWIKRYTGPERKHFRATLATFDTVRPTMEKIFNGYDIPRDLVYLCMVESGGRPNAISPSGATGYWQFTASTAKNYKLVVTNWVDERRDLVKSTHAAARYLKNLYGIFNDWLLAGAAYNAGEGNLYRIMKKHPEINTYWDISHHMSIKNETLDYIPKLIATIVLAKNRAYYGLDESDERKGGSLAYETVRVPSYTYLNEIADLLKVPNKQIVLMNADLIKQCTPPSENGHDIKVPKGTAEIVSQYVQNSQARGDRDRARDAVRDKEKGRDKGATHKVQKGETLYSIAKAYAVTVKDLRAANSLEDDDAILIGQKLSIPTEGRETDQDKAAKPKGGQTHTVAKGETLKGIARRHGVSVDAIIEANGLRSPKAIRPRMVLSIPSKEDKKESPRKVQYKVKKGDTVWSISRHFEVSATDVLKWNKLGSAAAIHPGDKLTIRIR